MILLGASLLFLLGLVVTTACYFVLIPINRAVTDTPSRMLSIYQSGGFLIGSFIVYKVIRYFYSKKHEEEEEVTLKNIKETMKDLLDKLTARSGDNKTTNRENTHTSEDKVVTKTSENDSTVITTGETPALRTDNTTAEVPRKDSTSTAKAKTRNTTPRDNIPMMSMLPDSSDIN